MGELPRAWLHCVCVCVCVLAQSAPAVFSNIKVQRRARTTVQLVRLTTTGYCGSGGYRLLLLLLTMV